MQRQYGRLLGATIAAAAALAAALPMPAANAASERALFISAGGGARAPIGWIEFCSEYAPECETRPLEARVGFLAERLFQTREVRGRR